LTERAKAMVLAHSYLSASRVLGGAIKQRAIVEQADILVLALIARHNTTTTTPY
jgi:hypothetical protein